MSSQDVKYPSPRIRPTVTAFSSQDQAPLPVSSSAEPVPVTVPDGRKKGSLGRRRKAQQVHAARRTRKKKHKLRYIAGGPLNLIIQMRREADRDVRIGEGIPYRLF